MTGPHGPAFKLQTRGGPASPLPYSPGLAHPPEQEHQADQRDKEAQELYVQEIYKGGALGAGEGVPQNVQDHGRQEGADYPPVQGCVTHVESLPPQDGTHQPRPRQVPSGRGEAPHDEHLVKDFEVFLRLQERDEAVSHRLQASEGRRGSYPQHYAGCLRTVAPQEVEHERQDELRRLLYKAYAELGQESKGPRHVVLQGASHHRSKHPAPQKTDRERRGRHVPRRQPLVEVGQEGGGHKESAEQDDAGDIVGVGRGHERPLDEVEQDQAAHEGLKPTVPQKPHRSSPPRAPPRAPHYTVIYLFQARDIVRWERTRCPVIPPSGHPHTVTRSRWRFRPGSWARRGSARAVPAPSSEPWHFPKKESSLEKECLFASAHDH